MNSTERIFFRLERPGFPIDVVGITVLEPDDRGALPFSVIRRRLDGILEAAPFLRRRVSVAPMGIGEDHWVVASDVDLDDHIKPATCPAPGDERALLDLTLKLTAEPLDRARPLWEAWYVEGMADGRSALVLRGHHALTDGLGFMGIYKAIFDAERGAFPDEGSMEALEHVGLGADGAADDRGGDRGDDRGDGAGPDGARRTALVEEPGAAFRAAAEVPERLLVNTITGYRIARTVAAGTPAVAGRIARGLGKRLGVVGRDAAPAAPGEAAGDASAAATGGAPIEANEPRGLGRALPRLPRLPRFIPSFTSHPPVTRFNRHVHDPEKSMAVMSFPLAEIQEARKAHPGATMNDIILALTSGALRRYLEPLGELPAEPLLTTCPVSVRSDPGRESAGGHASGGGGGGNTFTAIWVELPVHLADPLERLAAVHAGSSRAKGRIGGSRASWDLLSDVGDLLLPGMVSAAMEFAGSRAFQVFPPTLNLSVSTLRGSQTPLYFCGRKIEHLYARTIICPPVHLFVHAITYDGKVEMGVLSVKQLLPDPDTFAAGLRAELDALLALTHA